MNSLIFMSTLCNTNVNKLNKTRKTCSCDTYSSGRVLPLPHQQQPTMAVPARPAASGSGSRAGRVQRAPLYSTTRPLTASSMSRTSGRVRQNWLTFHILLQYHVV